MRQALDLDVPPIRIECFDISNLGGTHTVASMVVFEGGAPNAASARRASTNRVVASPAANVSSFRIATSAAAFVATPSATHDATAFASFSRASSRVFPYATIFAIIES